MGNWWNGSADQLEVCSRGALVELAAKVEAIAVLVGMAETFIADQAAAVATAGVAEAAVPLIVVGAQRLVKSLAMDLEQHLIGQVIEAAAKPLFAKVEVAMASLDWSASGSGVQRPDRDPLADERGPQRPRDGSRVAGG